MIEKQINGAPELNFAPEQGEVVAPYLSWGPYLWADGINPREDGLTWLAEDMRDDCTHPSQSGNLKVANMLLEFFKMTRPLRAGSCEMGWRQCLWPPPRSRNRLKPPQLL